MVVKSFRLVSLTSNETNQVAAGQSRNSSETVSDPAEQKATHDCSEEED